MLVIRVLPWNHAHTYLAIWCSKAYILCAILTIVVCVARKQACMSSYLSSPIVIVTFVIYSNKRLATSSHRTRKKTRKKDRTYRYAQPYSSSPSTHQPKHPQAHQRPPQQPHLKHHHHRNLPRRSAEQHYDLAYLLQKPF